MDGNVIGTVTSGGPSPDPGPQHRHGLCAAEPCRTGHGAEGHRARQARRRRGRRHALRRPTLLSQTESLRIDHAFHQGSRVGSPRRRRRHRRHHQTRRRRRWATWCSSRPRTPARPSRKGDSFAVVESVKAASDVYAPVSGEVIEGNAALAAAPGNRQRRSGRRRLVRQDQGLRRLRPTA